jgi:hypothetical protein
MKDVGLGRIFPAGGYTGEQRLLVYWRQLFPHEGLRFSINRLRCGAVGELHERYEEVGTRPCCGKERKSTRQREGFAQGRLEQVEHGERV